VTDNRRRTNVERHNRLVRRKRHKKPLPTTIGDRIATEIHSNDSRRPNKKIRKAKRAIVTDLVPAKIHNSDVRLRIDQRSNNFASPWAKRAAPHLEAFDKPLPSLMIQETREKAIGVLQVEVRAFRNEDRLHLLLGDAALHD
jgi:hypothetical protein